MKQNNKIDPSILITVGEVATYIGVHADTVRRWDKEGVLKPHTRVANYRLYKLAHVDKFRVQREKERRLKAG